MRLARCVRKANTFARALDATTTFGFAAVTLMLVFYAFEEFSPWCALGFAAACAMGSSYGFLIGSWPFGVVEGIWSLVALRRWLLRVRRPPAG